jgi:hypothetical protein
MLFCVLFARGFKYLHFWAYHQRTYRAATMPRKALCPVCGSAAKTHRANGITKSYPPIISDLLSNWLVIYMVATPILKLRGRQTSRIPLQDS